MEVVSLFNREQPWFGLTSKIAVMLMEQFKVEDTISELRSQGLTVTQLSASNETWYIKGDGIYQGYVATGDELIELARTNELNLLGVKSLG